MAVHDDLGPLPRVTARDLRVERARTDLLGVLVEWETRHGLTPGETLQLLAEALGRRVRPVLERERRGFPSPRPDSGIRIVAAGVGPGHPKNECSFCGRALTPDEAIATCTATAYVTLCPECYDRAGNSVR